MFLAACHKILANQHLYTLGDFIDTLVQNSLQEGSLSSLLEIMNEKCAI